MPPALFDLVILEAGSHFLPRPAWASILLFKLPAFSGMTGMSHFTQLSFIVIVIGSSKLFAQAGPGQIWPDLISAF
jgi:hypothetical protein